MTKDDRQAFEVPDRLFEYVRSVVDNRALATVLLFLLSLLLIGIDNIVGILAVLLVGFLLIDRFEIVCRCVVIGGAAWAMTLAIGAMALGGHRRAGAVRCRLCIQHAWLCAGACSVRAVLVWPRPVLPGLRAGRASMPIVCWPLVFKIA